MRVDDVVGRATSASPCPAHDFKLVLELEELVPPVV